MMTNNYIRYNLKQCENTQKDNLLQNLLNLKVLMWVRI